MLATTQEATNEEVGAVEYDTSNASSSRQVINWEQVNNINNDYVIYSDIEHIYKVPQMYIGSINPTPRVVYGYNGGKMIQLNTYICEGIIRFFLELVTNISDAMTRTKKAGVDCGKITVTIDHTRITARNGGLPIKIERHPQRPELWNPEVIFGVLRSSSNYNGDREGAGINGLGIKLANIFSVRFEVKIGDNINRKEYSQLWEHNMRAKHPAVIIDNYFGPAYVEISYDLDFSRFGLTDYSNTYIAHFAWITASLSVSTRMPVELNYPQIVVQEGRDEAGNAISQTSEVPTSVILDYRKSTDFALAMFEDRLRKNPMNGVDISRVSKFELAKLMELEQKDKDIKRFLHFTVPSPDGFDYLAEVVLMDTPYQASAVTFVNAMPTYDGGKHVDDLYKAFGDPLVKKMKETAQDEITERSKISHLVTISHVKSNVSMVAFFHIKNPDFGGGQSKTKLPFFPYKLTIPSAVEKTLSKWSFCQEIDRILDDKYKKELIAKGGKKVRNQFLKEKAENANEAGGPRSLECTLWITEGDSAANYAHRIISKMPGGRDLHGVLPVRGKLINVLKASNKQLNDNEEFIILMKMLGLQPFVDYSNLEMCKRDLRYGKVELAADADPDGSHIRALALNMIGHWFELLGLQFVGYIRTPIRRVYKHNKLVLSIFTSQQLEQFMAQVGGKPEAHGFEIRYGKGLGSWDSSDIDADGDAPYLVNFVLDSDSKESLNLAFNTDYIDKRKQWLLDYKEQPDIEGNLMTVSDFIKTELAQFSIYNLYRSLPNICGHKPTLTKIIYYACKKWNYNRNSKEIKVMTFGSGCSEKTQYHHGDKSMYEAIVGMTQDFVGANQLPYFEGRGQFGTRRLGGEDAASERYLHVKPSWWLFLVFRKEDHGLLTLLEEEGEPAEPVTMLPTIPLIAINGVQGIGTGWSTFIPCHRVSDICNYLIALIINQGNVPKNTIKVANSISMTVNGVNITNSANGEAPPAVNENGTAAPEVKDKVYFNDCIQPYYRGFKGKNKLTNKKNKKLRGKALNDYVNTLPMSSEPQDTVELGADEMYMEGAKHVFVSKGVFEYRGNNVVITELPIGRWTVPYSAYLTQLAAKGIVASVRDVSKPETVHIEVRNVAKGSNILRLTRRYGMNNMITLNSEHKPVTHERIEDVVEAFYRFRLPYYYKRREVLIKKIKDDLVEAQYKHYLLTLINSGQIEVRDRPQKDIYEDLNRFQIPIDIYRKLKIHKLNKDELPKVTAEIQKLESQLVEAEGLLPENIWLQEIDEFMKQYKHHYPDE